MQLECEITGSAAQIGNPHGGALLHKRQQVEKGLAALLTKARILRGIPLLIHARDSRTRLHGVTTNPALIELLHEYSPGGRDVALAARAVVRSLIPDAVDEVDPKDKLLETLITEAEAAARVAGGL
jgi:hypothetical protein